MLAPPVMVTVFRLAGTQLAFAPEFEAPNIYPKWVLALSSFLAPAKGRVILVSSVQPSNAL